MRNNIRNIVFFGIVLIGGIFLFFNRHILEQFKNLRLTEILLPLAACLVAFFFLSLGFKFLLQIFHIDLSFKEWFGLTICNIMFNYYLPAKGGSMAKAYYLNKKFDFKYSYYISLLSGSFMISLALTSLLGLSAVFSISIFRGRLVFPLVLFFLFILVCIVLIFFIAKFLLKFKFRFKMRKLTRILENLRNGLTHFSNNRKLTLYFSLCTALYFITMAGRLYLSFKALDVQIDFIEIVIVRALTELSLFVSLVPGNLGLKEGVIIFSSGMFDITSHQAAAAALLDRAVSMIIIFGFGFFFSKILLGKLETRKHGKIIDEKDKNR